MRPTGGPKRDDVRGPLLGSRFLGSFVPAVRGLGRAARAERNLRIQLGAGVVALGLAAGLRLDAVEWACVILAVGLVITTELVMICDIHQRNFGTTCDQFEQCILIVNNRARKREP